MVFDDNQSWDVSGLENDNCCLFRDVTMSTITDPLLPSNSETIV